MAASVGGQDSTEDPHGDHRGPRRPRRPRPAASAVDAFGHAQPAEVGDGRLRLRVSATPLFVTAA